MKNKKLLILGIVLFIVIFERILSATLFFKQLELITYDIRAKIATDFGPFNKKFRHADENIVIVAVDDYSRKEIAKYPDLNAELGSFPWRRNVWAGVVNFIEKGEPKIVLFDLIFNDLNENTWNDRIFAQELRKYDNMVLATSLNDPKYLVDRLKKDSIIVNSDYSPTPRPLNVKIDNKRLDDLITYYSHAPVHNFYTEHNTMGVVNKIMDADSTIRTSQPVFKLIKNDEVYYLPSLAFAGFLKYMGEEGEIAIENDQIFYKDRLIPIDENGQVNISWHGTGKNYTFIPVSKILLSEENEEYIKSDYFKDKIVIIGRTEAGTDIHSSSVNPSYAGPEANATTIDNFINDSCFNCEGVRKFVTKLSKINAFLLTVLCCIFVVLIGLISKNALVCFLNTVGFIILYLLISIWVFADPAIRVWTPVVVPVYYLIMTGMIVFAYRFQQELAKRATIMNMFGKFVSPKVLSTLLKKQDDLVLKSTKKRITVMFCDIKNFTTLSEKCNPEQLVDNLNELFNEIVNIVFENNGTVDKFIGDCIMAYWGDPIASEDDAYMAVKTALEIKKKVNELKIENAKENKIIFDVKIGINTGEALLGLSGSNKIMSYTAMGDAVNVASRLEANCSKLNKDVLISKSTYKDAQSKIIVLDAGKISVKGREEQIEIYEPIGLIEEQ
ncbi:MAG: adenylate/guanylate cyclase domain-containing protein [Candidatus Gastranaerophilales bacterium]|nr:adenylate/guanylate cyclase domain-containing protein [Candidatus Gastranaerophilales bacterium]